MAPAHRSAIRAISLALGLAIITADQLTKWLILHVLMTEARVIEVTSFFNIVLVYNSGISFGIGGAGSPLQTWLLIGVSAIIVLVLLYWLWRMESRVMALAIGAVAGGAIGNIIDRIVPSRRAVVDFLDFHAFGYHWPAFNIADSAIVLGVFVLVASSLAKDHKTTKS